jgi:hypothetical protein
MNPCDYLLWAYLKDRVYRTNPQTVQELQAETEAVAEQITGGRLPTELTTCGSFTAKDLILNLRTHEDHMHINSP